MGSERFRTNRTKLNEIRFNFFRIGAARKMGRERKDRKLTNRMWFSVVCTRIDNEYASSQWSKCCGLKRRSRVSPQRNFNHNFDNVNVKSHLGLGFFPSLLSPYI